MTTNNNPAHGPVSLDRLHQISEILSKAAAQSDGGNLGYAMADAVKVIDVAIASFCAEPVGEVVLGEYDDCGSYPDARVVCIAADGQADWENFKDGTRLYAVNPAQVSIDERAAFNAWNNDENLPIAGVGAKNAAWLAWQARATMLQSFGNSEQLKPLSHGVKLPLDYLQCHKDGLEWAAQLAEANHPQTGDWFYDDPIELAGAIRKGPDMPPVQTASVVDADDNFYSWFGREWEKYYQPNNYSLSAKKHLGAIAESAWFACRAAMLQAGNSPVTPDCWIPVIERMPERDVYVQLYCADSREQMVGYMEREESEGYFRFSTWRSGKGIYCKPTHWMPLPAAPLQEVKS